MVLVVAVPKEAQPIPVETGELVLVDPPDITFEKIYDFVLFNSTYFLSAEVPGSDKLPKFWKSTDLIHFENNLSKSAQQLTLNSQTNQNHKGLNREVQRTVRQDIVAIECEH